MATPVRYPNGVGNVKPSDACRNLPMPSLTRVNYLFDDFNWHSAAAAASDGSGSKWATASEAEGVQAMIDGDGGQIRLTAGSGANERFVMYTQKEMITLEAGRRAWFGIRCKMATDLTKGIFLFGLTQTDTDPLTVTDRDGVYFKKDAADTNVDIEMIASSSAVARDTAIDTADGSMHTYEFEFDGVSTVTYFIDGVQAGGISSASFPTTELGVTIALQPSSDQAALATCPDLDIDWVYAAKERLSAND